MPLREEHSDGNRRAAKRGLALSLALLGLVLAVPLILPFAVPIEVKLGKRWLRLEAGTIPAVQQVWINPGPGYTEILGQPTLVMGVHTADPLKPVFRTNGEYHWWWYRFAGVLYSVEWFDGARWTPDLPVPLPTIRARATGSSP